ncbi:hypothetical protein V8C40DRAFT_244553 [Trichoderma camerunense]
MVRFRCQHFVRVHRQNSSHVAAAAEPLTANENVVQGAHRNTPRASLCTVKSTLLSLSFSCRSAPSGLVRLSPERRAQLAVTLHCRGSTALAGTCILLNVTLRMLGTFYQLHGYSPELPKAAPPPAP